MNNPAEAVRSQAVLIPAGIRSGIYRALQALTVAEPVILLRFPEAAPWIVVVFGIAQLFGFVVARSNVPRQ